MRIVWIYLNFFANYNVSLWCFPEYLDINRTYYNSINYFLTFLYFPILKLLFLINPNHSAAPDANVIFQHINIRSLIVVKVQLTLTLLVSIFTSVLLAVQAEIFFIFARISVHSSCYVTCWVLKVMSKLFKTYLFAIIIEYERAHLRY